VEETIEAEAKNEAVEVEMAIRHGRRRVMYPSMVLLFLPLSAFVGVSVVLGEARISPWLGAAGVIGPLAASWLWWSVTLPKWRVWAIDHVDDLGELLVEAIGNQLMWPPGNFFERSEIQPRSLRFDLQRALRRALARYAVLHPEDEPALRQFVDPWLYPGRRRELRPGSGAGGIVALMLGMSALVLVVGGGAMRVLYESPMDPTGVAIVGGVGVVLTVWGQYASEVELSWTLSLFLMFLGLAVGSGVLRSYPWRAAELLALALALLAGGIGYVNMRRMKGQ
jgi:hypothetical protein